jgi:hypothetical protein
MPEISEMSSTTSAFAAFDALAFGATSASAAGAASAFASLAVSFLAAAFLAGFAPPSRISSMRTVVSYWR